MSPENALSKIMISKVVTIDHKMTVEQALNLLDEKQIRSAPVVDDNGKLLGMFSSHDLLASLVPIGVMDGVLPKLNFAHGAAPAIASKLRRLYPHPVTQYMDTNIVTLNPGDSTWESLRLLSKHKQPLPVVESKSYQLIGIVTEQSAIDALLHIEDEEEE